MEIKDNRELMRQSKAVKEEVAETCRVCGSKKVHTMMYNKPTMDCIQHLRVEIQKLDNGLKAFRRSMGVKQ